MAKRKTSTAITRTQIIRAPAPIVRVSVPRAAPAARVKRRSSSNGRGGGFMSRPIVNMGIAGMGVGIAVKSGLMDKLPEIPVIGRIGTAALILDYYGKHGGGDMVRNAAVGCAFLAGYQMGTVGKIEGDDDVSPDDDSYDDDDDE